MRFLLLGLLFLILHGNNAVAAAAYGQEDPRNQRLERTAERRLGDFDAYFSSWRHVGKITIDSLKVQRQNELLTVYFSPAITHLPIRHAWLRALEIEMKNALGRRFRNYRVEMIARNQPLEAFVPNLFRDESLPADHQRVRTRTREANPLVRRSSLTDIPNGLSGNHIALWHSHGLYYNAGKDRWEWQRARLFGTVEDLFPAEYVLKYIAPMLENAGANVFLPRERDVQTHEVIVDNDRSTGASRLVINHGHEPWETMEAGFEMKEVLYEGENPFQKGTHLQISSNSGGSLIYIPGIPQTGEYAVYLSWAATDDNVPDVSCVVNYSGGSATFTLNQQMGAGTWVYLGTFRFEQGSDASRGSLSLYTHSGYEGTITADAVRFGGGMGNVARRPAEYVLPNERSVDDRGSSMSKQTEKESTPTEIQWKTSGQPRFVEGSRYYLQYAGMPDTLVYSLNEGKNDYNDDFMSRGEWVNYLTGGPLGPERDREATGLGIPIDLSFAFHTDAGITRTDSVIGTLSIYSGQRDEGLFPDGVSRLASRDLTDIIQDQLVGDIRALYNPHWTRRAIWDRQYSEAWRPNVPAMLMELLSHQNLADMRFGHDPGFQFDVSRAIYKGMLRFIAHQEGREAVIQPLPPQNFSMETTGGKTIRLAWEPATDVLEPSAAPDAYILYIRGEGKGFDQGMLVETHEVEIELPSWNKVYSFQVTAVNEGGESFPSEILSVAMVPGQEKTVLIVNGFQRTSGHGTFDNEQMAGITWWDDHAIPYGYSLSFTGNQYDFDRNSPWLDDDSPGWGAGYADNEGRPVAGNTFDYPYTHGVSLRNAGYSFVSVSREAFENESFAARDYFMINLIMGKQKGTPHLMHTDSIHFRVFTPGLMQKVREYAESGGNIMISGAYIGTDNKIFSDSLAMNFTRDVLGYSWRTNNACNVGELTATDYGADYLPEAFRFVVSRNVDIYHVEAPDAIEAEGKNSRTVYRYSSNVMSAAVFHQSQHKVLSMGFPFEAIIGQENRDALMKAVLELFE